MNFTFCECITPSGVTPRIPRSNSNFTLGNSYPLLSATVEPRYPQPLAPAFKTMLNEFPYTVEIPNTIGKILCETGLLKGHSGEPGRARTDLVHQARGQGWPPSNCLLRCHTFYSTNKYVVEVVYILQAMRGEYDEVVRRSITTMRSKSVRPAYLPPIQPRSTDPR